MSELKFQLPEAERNLLVEQYQPYVRKIAFQIFQKMGRRFDLEEIVGYGFLGLVEAAERYNPQRGISFTTFSYYRIKGAIFDGLREMGLPAKAAPRAVNWEANAHDLLQSATDDETSDAPTGNIEDEVESVGQLIENLIPAYLLSLESEAAQNLADTGASPAENLETSELFALIHSIIEELPEQERELLEAIYYRHIPMTQIAQERGIGKSWVSRLHARAVGRIRDRLKEIGFFISSD